MDVEDLLDLAALHGTTAVRPYLWRLSPHEQAELRDLLTLARHGDASRYFVPTHVAPAPRIRRGRERPVLAEDMWSTDTDKHFDDRAGAITRGRELQQKFTDIEIFERADKQWQVRFRDPVPTAKPPFDDANTYRIGAMAERRARVLRAYGFAVDVKKSGTDWSCTVKGQIGTPRLPKTRGPDTGFEYEFEESAQKRAKALDEVGFAANVKKLRGGEFQVQITALPTFPAIAASTTAPPAPKPTPPPPPTPKPPPPAPTPPAPKPPAPPAPTPTVPATAGHDPRGDYASGVMREERNLRDADLKTIRAEMFKLGELVTRKRTSGEWVEVEGQAVTEATGKPAGFQTGWVKRTWTSMTLGVFNGLRVDDRTATLGALALDKVFGAGDVKRIIVHQTESTSGASSIGTYQTRIRGGAKARPTVAEKKNKNRGAQYLITETGAIILVVPVNKVVEHIAGMNSTSVGIEHVGMPTSLPVPADAKDAAGLAALRKTIGGLSVTPKLKARILAMTDARLFRFARESRDDGVVPWFLYGDINALQKRASFLLVQKLETHFTLGDADVFAHEALVAKSPGEGENITEFLTARAAYPALVTRLEALVAKDPTLASDAALVVIVANERATVDALRIDGTVAETKAVASGTDAAATTREQRRTLLYKNFWTRFTQLDELVTFLATSGSTLPAQLAAKMTAWMP